ncbi:HYC_CC_PP family protein [Labilibaculum euxinus]|uniref:Uncharacterized protein n=1 Tax=Labilibaculum euxinus TaxID=2686357 RepID=A0A7M4D9R2_9BACT|nr:hypothetical protein [Labilibaculum euxinus]MUP39391.1 hypothetical protein [Labilibaculum euxinus]MVB08596.1 hypothetical protein [Labilibaculum euxinus]
MLKKFSHLLLALVIFVVTTGITVSIHYCGGNVKDVSFLAAPKACCEIPQGCCHNEVFTVKIENDFSISSYTFDFEQLEVALPVLIELIKVETPINVRKNFVEYIVPPPKIQTVLSRLQNYRL